MTTPKAFICGVLGHRLSDDEKRFLSREQPYGVILFARNCDTPAQVKALCAEIREQLAHPFAGILIDQEGGRVARLKPPHWRAYPPARCFADIAADGDMLGARDGAYLNARLIAEDLRGLGITINCAPLADVPSPECHDIIGDRAFGDTPSQVITLARAQADGLLDGGVLPVLKHIPGHGRARADSHLELPVVHASRAELEATDFAPFVALSDIPLGMTAHIIYEALDAERCATVSPVVIDLIRQHLNFDGLLMSDDLSMKALRGSYENRTCETLAAGCDLALHCNGNMTEMLAIASVCAPMNDAALRRAERAASLALRDIRPLPADAEIEWTRFAGVQLA
jgi:beta-N-acetylhexosaminidase